ncbi:MAG: hypothetical protein P9M08_05685 [Candidatus Erginobacter occultus]|nr:hypothetical protein [Candidatus Erginobacter occultus]
MDLIVELAEKHDVYLLVVLYPNFVGGQVGNWRFHPYSKQQGGPIEHYYELVTNAAVWEIQKARFRMFVDNWGKSSHIFSWELFNEFWHPPDGWDGKRAIEAHNR